MLKIRYIQQALIGLLLLAFVSALPLMAQHHDMAPKLEKQTAAEAAAAPHYNAPQGNPAQIGSWTAPTKLGVVAIHAVLLRTGKVLVWWYPQGSATHSPSRLFDPKTGKIKDVTIPFEGDFFCAGQNVLPDGRVMVTGGLVGNPYPGVPDAGTPLTAFFDPITETWTQGPNMNLARWYPTNIELNNGNFLTVSGKNETATHIQLQLELFNPNTGIWTTLPDTANIKSGTDTYPKLKLLTTGKVFWAGADDQSKIFNPATKTWINSAVMNFGDRYHGAAVLLPGTADKPLTKIMVAGGTVTFPGGGATATAEVIDTSAATPVWTYVNPMNIPRYNANMIVLADGTVMEIGGAQVKKYTDPVLIPEIYNPDTDTWTEMAAQTAPRPYHSTALLLPDGTVFSAGSDDPANVGTDTTYEIFSPPYLFNGARPTISSAPTSMTYNTNYTIGTPDAANIKSVALVRPGAITHDNEMDQRYVPLKFTKGGARLKVQSPLNANYAPPGYYMLVIVNTSGVPSVMQFLQVQ